MTTARASRRIQPRETNSAEPCSRSRGMRQPAVPALPGSARVQRAHRRLRGGRSGRAVARGSRRPQVRLPFLRPQARQPGCPQPPSAPRPHPAAQMRAGTSAASTPKVLARRMCVRLRPLASGKAPSRIRQMATRAGASIAAGNPVRGPCPVATLCRSPRRLPPSSALPCRSHVARPRRSGLQSVRAMMRRSMPRLTSAPTTADC